MMNEMQSINGCDDSWGIRSRPVRVGSVQFNIYLWDLLSLWGGGGDHLLRYWDR